MLIVKFPNEAASKAKSAKGPDQGELARRLVAMQWLRHLLSAIFHIRASVVSVIMWSIAYTQSCWINALGVEIYTTSTGSTLVSFKFSVRSVSSRDKHGQSGSPSCDFPSIAKGEYIPLLLMLLLSVCCRLYQVAQIQGN
jgi:hypothetical protein